MAKVYHLRDVYSRRVVHYSLLNQSVARFITLHSPDDDSELLAHYMGKRAAIDGIIIIITLLLLLRLCIGSLYRGACK